MAKAIGLSRRWAGETAKNLIATLRALGMSDDEIKVELERLRYPSGATEVGE